jgi:hypothetical protein
MIELLYVRRFTANQFVLAPSPLRLTARFFFRLNTCCNPYVTSSLARGWVWINFRVESSSLMLRRTVSRPACLGVKHPSGAYDQIFITATQLRFVVVGRPFDDWMGLSLVLASAVILGSEARGTRGHILLSQIGDYPFRRLLRLVGLRWRYSTPPPHGNESVCVWLLHFDRLSVGQSVFV